MGIEGAIPVHLRTAEGVVRVVFGLVMRQYGPYSNPVSPTVLTRGHVEFPKACQILVTHRNAANVS